MSEVKKSPISLALFRHSEGGYLVTGLYSVYLMSKLHVQKQYRPIGNYVPFWVQTAKTLYWRTSKTACWLTVFLWHSLAACRAELN